MTRATLLASFGRPAGLQNERRTEKKEGDRERKRETSAIEREKEKGSLLSANEFAKRNKRTRRQVDRLTGRFLKYFAQS